MATPSPSTTVRRVLPPPQSTDVPLRVRPGSLIARIVFQPVEETLRVFFSKLLSGTRAPADKHRPPREALEQSARALVALLAVQAAFAVLLLVFGTAYMPIALHVLLPSQYLSTSAPAVLAAWVWYIPVLAVNGGLEAFLSSVASAEDLNKQSRCAVSIALKIIFIDHRNSWMAGFSVVYISSALALYGMHLGDASLVYANIINLSARIGYCVHFISVYYRSHEARAVLRWKDALPRRGVLLTAILSGALIWYSKIVLDVTGVLRAGGRAVLLRTPIVLHVLLGMVLAVLSLGVWWFSSGRFIHKWVKVE